VRLVDAIYQAVLLLGAIAAAYSARRHLTINKELTPMESKGAKTHDAGRTNGHNAIEKEDLLDDAVTGEFAEIPQSLEAAIGAICRLSVINGGYFGVSVTDDRVSCRIVVNTGKGKHDRRYYRLADFSDVLAKLLPKLKQ